ncbi:MAG: hypothetical protein WAR77_03240 [Saprospiraceae bacterium]
MKIKKISQEIFLMVLFVQLLLLLNGCSTKIGMFVHANIAPLPSYQYEFSDGYPGTYYVHQKGNKENSDVIVFFIGGSGHTSYFYYLRQYFNELQGNTTIYALQKRYVKKRETGMRKASKEFDYHNYHSQIVQDQKEFIIGILKSNDFKHKKIVLFGVSEGGNISVHLAKEIQEITHLILLGSGGMPALEEFKMWGNQYNMDFDLVYQEVKKYPENIKLRVAGQTYKYWASALPFKPMDYFKSLTIPILVANGEKDEMAPVESVYFMQNEFKKLKKENLIVKVFADCSHTLEDSDGKNHKAEFFRIASDWWNK